MDYEQKYKEALKKARQLCAYPTSKPFISDLQDLFPELKESEDEKIRKELLNYLYDVHDDDEDRARWLAWLEKQVSQDNTEDVNILHRFSFYSYKDEPNVLYLSGLYVNEEYRNKGIGTKILEVADEVVKSLNCRAIRLKTKKDSDAERLYRIHGYNSLATEDKDEIWLEKQGKKELITCPICGWEIEKQGEQKPADKEKSLTDVEKFILNFADYFHSNRCEPESKWIDEIKMLRDYIPSRILKSAAWSKEDERHLNNIIKRTVAYGDSSIYGLIKDDIAWLKSLKQLYSYGNKI